MYTHSLEVINGTEYMYWGGGGERFMHMHLNNAKVKQMMVYSYTEQQTGAYLKTQDGNTVVVLTGVDIAQSKTK